MTDTSPRTPREALTRALYLRQTWGVAKTDEMFDRAWRWLHDERNRNYWADSEVGQYAERADAVLRWIDAAGLEVKAKG